jgi:carbon monoxide dehydrogenase subunit G
MELTGSVTIHAKRSSVWQALNNPEVLSQCIPGCEEVREGAPGELLARVALKLGPVRARFVGRILVSEVRENEGYRLEFEGAGGAAGFAKGSSRVTLTDLGPDTELSYATSASVGGKLGQIGGRMIDVSARQMADEFFQKFARYLDPEQAAAPVSLELATGPRSGETSRGRTAQAGPFSESARILWFGLGAASTALGVLIGALVVR